MDKEEFQIKIDEIRALTGKKKYREAAELVDDIEWKRVKNVRSLCMAGEILAANKRYEDSRDLFLMAYKKSPTGKTILYRLVEVSLKLDKIKDAEKYYSDYVRIAPNDSVSSVLKYKIECAKDAPIENLINILEDYKEKEYTERWSYELAKLYFKAGEKEKCIETCDDLALWFHDGKYVEKCQNLKNMLGTGLPLENDGNKPEKETEIKRLEEEEISSGNSEFPNDVKTEEKEESDGKSLAETIESISKAVPIFNDDGEIHKKISDGIKNIFQGSKSENESDESPEDDDEQINGQINFSDIIPETPKVEESDVPPLESEDFVDMSFNLEDSILAAAQAQGIEVPDDPVEPEPAEEPEILPEDVPEEVQEEKEDAATEDAEISDEPQQTEEIKETDSSEESDTEDVSGTTDTAEVLPEENASEELADEEVSDDFKAVEEEKSSEPEPAAEEPDVEEEPENQEEPEKQAEQLSEEEELMRFIDEQNRDPNIDDMDIVPREEVLDDDEIKLFKYFSLVPGMKEQIAAALRDAQLSAADKTSTDGNIIIMGNSGCGKTMLAELLIKAICRELKIPAARVARIKAEQLAGQDIAKIVDKLSGGFLLIQNVNQLDSDSVNTLNQAMEFRTDGLTVLLEDEKIGMRKFIARNPKFIGKFTSTISIPVFTNDELVNFAKVYTQERGYVIDDMAILALYTLISDNQKEDEPMTVNGVKMIVDNAIAKEQSGLRKLLSRNHTDRDGNVILYEKDFK